MALNSVFLLTNDWKPQDYTEISFEQIKNEESIFQFNGFEGGFGGLDTDSILQDTSQRSNGDCWLLAGMNALNSCKAGKDIIKRALEYGEDGTIVHFGGNIGDYIVPNEAVIDARNDSDYSQGDDDMLIFELAIEALRNDIQDGKVDSPVTKDNIDENNLLSGGNLLEVIYYLTGVKPDTISVSSDNINSINSVLDEFSINNKKDMTLCFGTGDEQTSVQNLNNGKEIQLSESHAYTIVGCDKYTITYINPWDSSEKITISREDFLLSAHHIAYADLTP